ncbi:MAG: insulinase family protein [Cyclobacteriaceae bacterium]|nr:insulinase family protein [Cyclobacteriaceae bacterium]UYN88209.1 MAG: insulinase family protein [Cyclobacteriaceae bacterium]
MNRILLSGVLIWAVISCTEKAKFETKKGESGGYTYEYVTNDPLQARIYTLKNGLKVYLSQYNAAPRIYTQIAVKAGGKNDPPDATGLAHYLEHIMFKGSDEFGTLDWAKEKVMLDSIERMFEHYRTLTDSMERVNYYKKIDQYSNDAAKLAIANEYDKMITELGGRGLNAYTTEDRTVYINDIPANQLDNWLQIEASRFRTIVPRLFHTELEAVYEEKNGGLDDDYWKSFEAMFGAAFKKHPYGTQTVIGTIDHLKNPSITEIKNYFTKYYRPNNVAICLSGDLDYDKTIALIDKYFSDWEANESLEPWNVIEEDPITSPTEVEITGPDAEWIYLAYRFPDRKSKEYQLLRLTDMILANSKAGLIDINLKQKQRVIEPGSFLYDINDYNLHVFNGKPKEGQTLDQVRDLFLEQIELVKKGDFEDWLLDAVVNDLKKNKIRGYENNYVRSDEMVTAFTNGIDWATYVGEIEALRKFSKEDVIKFANQHYGNNYILIKKITGKDPNEKKVVKPAITKVTLNKEDRSPFHEAITKKPVEKLQPVFLDYEKDVRKLSLRQDVPVLYNQNKENDLFRLYYLLDAGTNNDPKFRVAVEYLEFLGTDKLSAEDVKKELYKIGCGFSVFAAEDQTYITLEGLSENMDKAIAIMEDLLTNAKADEQALKNMIDDIFKKRDDTKKDKYAIMFDGLMNYGLYGANSPFTNVLSNSDLRKLQPDELVNIIKGFTKMKHKVLYYGPLDEQTLLASLEKLHVLPETLNNVPPARDFVMVDVTDPSVYWTHYDMVQTEAVFMIKGDKFDKAKMPYSRLYNEYMGSQVFRELREAQGLAYGTFTSYQTASKASDTDSFFGYIGTQADKQAESLNALRSIIYTMPETEDGFKETKEAVLSVIESERIIKQSVLFNYLTAEKRGLNYDIRRDIYEQVKTMTLADIKKFQEENIKNKKYNLVLITSRDKVNLKDLAKYGKVKELSLDEIFGYEKEHKINLEAPNQ